jgi:hypothetical protein
VPAPVSRQAVMEAGLRWALVGLASGLGSGQTWAELGRTGGLELGWLEGRSRGWSARLPRVGLKLDWAEKGEEKGKGKESLFYF